MPSVKKSRIRDMMGIKGIVNDNKTKLVNSFLPQFEAQKRQCGGGEAVGWNLRFLEREREHLLSRFPADRIVGSQRSKKQGCSTRRGLRVDIDLVEFRKLQEVGIFSYLR